MTTVLDPTFYYPKFLNGLNEFIIPYHDIFLQIYDLQKIHIYIFKAFECRIE